ncbi:MAG: antibiotic biosynthesis monooxygenase family protein [Mycobacteriaceae bacterium]
MVTEIADITVHAGSVAEFPAAFERGAAHLRASPGFVSARLTRSIESPQRFVLLVEWESLAAHTEGFRSSPAFAAWRGEVGPHFDGAPVVEHLLDVHAVSAQD